MSHFWKKKISMNKKSRLFCHSQIAPSLPDSSKDLFHGVEIFRTKQHLCPCRDVRNGPSLNSYKFCRLPGSHFRSGVFLKTLGGGSREGPAGWQIYLVGTQKQQKKISWVWFFFSQKFEFETRQKNPLKNTIFVHF